MEENLPLMSCFSILGSFDNSAINTPPDKLVVEFAIISPLINNKIYIIRYFTHSKSISANRACLHKSLTCRVYSLPSLRKCVPHCLN